MSWQTPSASPLGLLPLAADVEDLGPVHPADAGVQRRERQGVAPALRRLGPLAGPAEVDQLVAGAEEAAVDRARPHRLQLVGQRRQHRLVEQGESPRGPGPA